MHTLSGIYTKSDLWRHVAHSPFNEKSKEDTKNRKLQYESELLLYGSKDVDREDNIKKAFHDHVIAAMRVDEISLTAKTDELILLFGQSHFEKVGSVRSTYISQNMRSLARLLSDLQKVSKEERKVADFISPTQFDAIIAATKVLCSHNIQAENDHLSAFDRPSLALKVGNHLKRCASILRGIALRKQDTGLKDDAEAFIDLMESEWGSKISSAALRNLSDKKFNKAPILPVTSDLLKLREYLLDEIPKSKTFLRELPTLENWRNLAELTASRVILFNKCRGNEATKLEVNQFKEHPNWSEKEYLAEANSQLNNPNLYQELSMDLFNDYQQIIINSLNEMLSSNMIDEETADILKPNSVKPARFYLLPKIHKKNIPGRPVISSINCHTTNLSRYVDYYIQPLATKVKSYIRDTTDFINKLQNIAYVPHNALLATLDVKSLYSNINHNEGLLALEECLDTRAHKEPST